MTDIVREKLKCERCGWEWHKRLGGPDPRRCPNADCRSVRWREKPQRERTLEPIEEL